MPATRTATCRWKGSRENGASDCPGREWMKSRASFLGTLRTISHRPQRLLVMLLALVAGQLLLGCVEDTTPVPAPQKSTGVSFTTDDGIELKGRVFGQGDTGVVLSHMFPGEQRSWWAFAGRLAESGYVTLTFNFRGYGEGAEGSSGEKEIKLIYQDVRAAVKFLEDRGASEVFLVGASMGGTASLKVAGHSEGSVAGVVSLSAPLDFKGLSVRDDRVRVPALLIATEGDGSAMESIRRMVEGGVVTEAAQRVIYDKTGDHGTDILNGENGADAASKILAFLKAHAQ